MLGLVEIEMDMHDQAGIEAALKAAFEIALTAVGVDAFKRTSLFLSNETIGHQSSKLAA
jgi:hypothetical protein